MPRDLWASHRSSRRRTYGPKNLCRLCQVWNEIERGLLSWTLVFQASLVPSSHPWLLDLLPNQYDRARVIYKYALDRLPKSKSESLYNHYTQFEKQYGDKEGIEDVVVGKRRVQYEEEISQNSKNYDVWFDYARLEESNGEPGRVREVYERAIAQVPPTKEKRFWRRYIYLWINYALYEELETKVCAILFRSYYVGRIEFIYW